ncbi:MAG TPA: hypothetical protein VEW26_15690 [Allosphingosinicella sp.]|nr:hypothetical protein [Allosphingosinicella sp.]
MTKPAPPRPHPRWPGLVASIAAGLLFFAFVAFPFLFVWAWSGAHCEPKPECQRFAERAVLIELAVILGLAGLMGASVRALVDWAFRRRRAEGAVEAAPRWAVAGLVGLTLLMVWIGSEMRV